MLGKRQTRLRIFLHLLNFASSMRSSQVYIYILKLLGVIFVSKSVLIILHQSRSIIYNNLAHNAVS